MIVYKGGGNIFTTDVELKVCPVNTLGVMGNGLALAFKWKYPKVYEHYRKLCLAKQFTVDQILVCDEVVCFPTKKEFYLGSKVEYLENNLKKLAAYCRDKKIESLAIPAIGCGKGGLPFNEVEALIEKYLGDDLETWVWFLTKKERD